MLFGDHLQLTVDHLQALGLHQLDRRRDHVEGVENGWRGSSPRNRRGQREEAAVPLVPGLRDGDPDVIDAIGRCRELQDGRGVGLSFFGQHRAVDVEDVEIEVADSNLVAKAHEHHRVPPHQLHGHRVPLGAVEDHSDAHVGDDPLLALQQPEQIALNRQDGKQGVDLLTEGQGREKQQHGIQYVRQPVWLHFTLVFEVVTAAV